AVKSVRLLVRSFELRALPIHSIANEPRRGVEWIAFIRPPAINTHRKIFTVRVPVAASLFLVGTTRLTGIVHCPSEFVCLDYDVEHSAKVLLVEFIEDSLGIGKHGGVPGERAVLGIPAGGAEPGPQVDQRVAGQSLVPKRFRLGHDFLAAGEGAVGLLMSQVAE